MEYLIVDNGLEFHGNDLEALCYSFGITIMYMPRKTPWFKGVVERWIGTLNRGVSHVIPGTTFSDIFEKEDYDAAQNATLTLSTFKEVIHVWIVDYYHQKQHRSLGDTPLNVWLQNINEHDIPLPSDIDDLDYLLGSVAERTLSHKGIELNSIRYNSEELNELRYRKGPTFRVTIRYSKADLGYIHVIDPDTSKPIRVQAIDFLYADGLSEWQHQVCKRFARNYFDRSDLEALAQAKETIRQLIENDMGEKRIKTRKRAHRFVNAVEKDEPNINHYISSTTPLYADTERNYTDELHSSDSESLLSASNDEVINDNSSSLKKLKIVKNSY